MYFNVLCNGHDSMHDHSPINSGSELTFIIVAGSSKKNEVHVQVKKINPFDHHFAVKVSYQYIYAVSYKFMLNSSSSHYALTHSQEGYQVC